MSKDQKYPKEQQSLMEQITPKMRTITYADEAAPWSRSSHLIGTRLLPLSDDSDNNCPRTTGESELR
jgi:hypothetical protein